MRFSRKLLPNRTFNKQISMSWLRQIVMPSASPPPLPAAATVSAKRHRGDEEKAEEQEDEVEKQDDEIIRSFETYVKKRKALHAELEAQLAAVKEQRKDLQILRDSLIHSTQTFNDTLKQQWLADPAVRAKILEESGGQSTQLRDRVRILEAENAAAESREAFCMRLLSERDRHIHQHEQTQSVDLVHLCSLLCSTWMPDRLWPAGEWARQEDLASPACRRILSLPCLFLGYTNTTFEVRLLCLSTTDSGRRRSRPACRDRECTAAVLFLLTSSPIGLSPWLFFKIPQHSRSPERRRDEACLAV